MILLSRGIKDSASFAPLHNPAHLIGIAEALKSFPHLKEKNVAVFDTAFHQTMPEESYLYALPYSLYKEHGVRRYGAHGTSHFYVTQEAAKVLNKPVEELNIITCHLGNGGSVSAIRNGKCVDTSMGLTPLEGLVMGTRSGDIDPAIIFHLHDSLGMSVDAINKMLTKESGLLGLTEVTSDCRYVEDNYTDKADAKRAMDVYCHRLAKYIGSYTALMDGRLDAVIFTGGIGENAAMVRELSLGKLGVLGFEVDHRVSVVVQGDRCFSISLDDEFRVLEHLPGRFQGDRNDETNGDLAQSWQCPRNQPQQEVHDKTMDDVRERIPVGDVLRVLRTHDLPVPELDRSAGADEWAAHGEQDERGHCDQEHAGSDHAQYLASTGEPAP